MRAPVFDMVHSESIIFNRKAINKKINNPDFIFGIDRLVQRNREKINLCSVMSLYEFHIVKIQKPHFLKKHQPHFHQQIREVFSLTAFFQLMECQFVHLISDAHPDESGLICVFLIKSLTVNFS
jgi:hypothetical protein